MVCVTATHGKHNKKTPVNHIKVLQNLVIKKQERQFVRLLISQLKHKRKGQSLRAEWIKLIAIGDLVVSLFIFVWFLFLQCYALPMDSEDYFDLNYTTEIGMCVASIMAVTAVILNGSVRKNWNFGINVWIFTNMAIVFICCGVGLFYSWQSASRLLTPCILTAAFYKSFLVWTVDEFRKEMKTVQQSRLKSCTYSFVYKL